MKPWQYTPYTEDDCEEIAEIFKYLALERFNPFVLQLAKMPYDREIIEHAYWIFELTRCIRLGFTAPDYSHWRKVVFVIGDE